MLLTNLLSLDCFLKVQWGSLITDGRGKQGGSVYSRNKGGAYARNKVTGTNPKTASQTTVRNRLSTFSQGWRALTDAQRAEWIAASGNFPYTNQFNNTYYLSGNQLYIALNTTLQNAGASTLTSPPTPGAVTAPATASAAMAKGTPAVTITFTVSPIPAGMAWILKATGGLSPGKGFVSSQLRQIAVLPAAQTSTYNALTAYTGKFGTVPAAGQKVFFQLIPVNTATGQMGTALQFSCIVAA